MALPSTMLRALPRRLSRVAPPLAVGARVRHGPAMQNCFRNFSALKILRQDGHHWYFQKGSTQVNYPSQPTADASPVVYPGQRWHQGSQLKQTIQAGSENRWFRLYIFWFAFVTGFATCIGVMAASWVAYESEVIPGVNPTTYREWVEEVKAVAAEVRRRKAPAASGAPEAAQDAPVQGGDHYTAEEMQQMLVEFKQLQDTLAIANRAGILVHNLLVRLVALGPEAHVFRDDDLIRERPIHLKSGKRLSADDATLLQVVDAAGDAEAMILGVDLSAFQKDEWWPSEAQGISNWLGRVWLDTYAGSQTFPEDVTLIVYANTAVGVAIPTRLETGFNVQFFMTRIDAEKDFNLGFPLKLLKEAKFRNRDDVEVVANKVIGN